MPIFVFSHTNTQNTVAAFSAGPAPRLGAFLARRILERAEQSHAGGDAENRSCDHHIRTVDVPYRVGGHELFVHARVGRQILLLFLPLLHLEHRIFDDHVVSKEGVAVMRSIS